MMADAVLADHVNPVDFLSTALRATAPRHVEALLAKLPIVPEDEYSYDPEHPEVGWRKGHFHWLPVGQERGNAGRIKQANFPVNPIAERAVNGMEALIELARQRELLQSPASIAPGSPRDAVLRYFGLPPLDELPKLDSSSESKETRKRARELARHLRVRLIYDKEERAFTIAIEDDGIGQPPSQMHRTLLSLGSTTKADKYYLIGVFGQGGSSAYTVSEYSWVVSRRPADLLGGEADGAGWTIIRHFFPKGRRDDYFAYLACSPDGKVPSVTADEADRGKLSIGTRFVHIGYNFGKGGSAITRQLFQAMNHVLYNPVLPFDLYVGPTEATVYGMGYRISSRHGQGKPALDKVFGSLAVGG